MVETVACNWGINTDDFFVTWVLFVQLSDNLSETAVSLIHLTADRGRNVFVFIDLSAGPGRKTSSSRRRPC